MNRTKTVTANDLILYFDLKEHPEGGYFKEVYRAQGEISPENLGPSFKGSRNYCTSIYFLLTSDKFSAFHKINQDEIWHFYKGATLKLHVISPKGDYNFQKIGLDFKNEEVPQYTVPAHHYFAAEVMEENSYSFVGCTVSPGFDFVDFDLPSCQELSKKFSMHAEIIDKLTHH